MLSEPWGAGQYHIYAEYVCFLSAYWLKYDNYHMWRAHQPYLLYHMWLMTTCRITISGWVSGVDTDLNSSLMWYGITRSGIFIKMGGFFIKKGVDDEFALITARNSEL